MLIATAITLLMMAAVVNLFANLSASIRNRRAVIEVSAQIRQVRQRLARDLANCTVPPNARGLVPWQRRGEAVGYFEIVEGNRADDNPSILLNGTDNPPDDPELDYGLSLIPRNNMVRDWNNDGEVDEDDQVEHINRLGSLVPGSLGDWDDFLALTVRSDNEPFVAQVPGVGTVESQLAEIIWYAVEHQPGGPGPDEPGMRSIHRRVRIIAPWVSLNGPSPNISAHQDQQSGAWVANTLADLTRRENRYQHRYDRNSPNNQFEYPHELRDNAIRGDSSADTLMLTDVLAWDVRVYDPGAPLYQIGSAATNTIVDPSDPGWQSVVGGTPVTFGAYVDLGWNNAGAYFPPSGAPPTHFQFAHRAGWHPQFGVDPTAAVRIPDPDNPFRGMPAVYDTWSWHYENDGINQDGDTVSRNGQPVPLIDEGTNGVDDEFPADSDIRQHGVDDVMERETWPPYNVPLRGVKVILRAYERNSRQVREASVTNSFVP